MNRRLVAVLAACHVASDLSQGALPAMLPLFIAQRHFSYSVAAGLVMATSMTSSFLQPLFGWLADRWAAPWLAPAGLILASVGMGFVGIAPSYSALIVAAALSGLGLAMFHPEGARLIHRASGERRALGMSYFSVGGNLGFALGPLVTTAVIAWQGLRGSLLLIVPALVFASILIVEIRRMRGQSDPKSSALRAEEASQPDEWRPFCVLTASVVCRSLVFFGLNTFLPLYWINVFGVSRELGNSALSVFLFSGAIGTLLGGRIADRYSRRQMIAVSLICTVPLILSLALVTSPLLAVAISMPLGLFLFAPFSVMVVLGQEYLPARVGVASGVTIGLAGTVGGLGTPVLGAIADGHGLRAAIFALVAIAAVGAALTVFLRPPLSGQGIVLDEEIEVEI